MIIIDTWEDTKLLCNTLKQKNVKINRFPFMGVLHEGHIQLIKEIRKECDVLILHYNEFMNYLNVVLYDPNYKNTYERITDLLYKGLIFDTDYKVGNFVDYFVINKLPDENKTDKIFNRIYKDFLIAKEEIIRLNLPLTIAIEMMYIHLRDPLHSIISSDKSGAKQALQLMLHNKLYNNKSCKYDPTIDKYIIWKTYENEKGEAYSRSKKELSFLRPKVINLFNSSDKYNYEKYRKLIVGLLIGNKTFSVIDMYSLERIYEINDNCFIVYGSVFSYEIIIIKDGNLI